jgi:uncharacterized protein YndB with AHSA1/START domain
MTSSVNGADGRLERQGDQLLIRFERRYPRPVTEVWDAITNPERIAQWWLPFDADITLELEPGGDYVMRGRDDAAPTLSWKVLRVEAPHLFEHTHVEPGIVVTWQLAEHGSGCTLVLTQTVPDLAKAVSSNFIVGLHTSLDRLTSCLEGRPIPWDWGALAVLQRHYAQQSLAGTPESDP